MDLIVVIKDQNSTIYSILAVNNATISTNSDVISSKVRLKIPLDAAFCEYFVKELFSSATYRLAFLKNISSQLKSNGERVDLILKPTKNDSIDYNWNDRVFVMVRERCELDHALSWLSTLGGAFSALGDYYTECAETAGKISVNQLRLAMRMGDESITERARLYFALSLIQKKCFKAARRIIRDVYIRNLDANILDVRLQKMCKGIWSKLQYEHSLSKK